MIRLKFCDWNITIAREFAKKIKSIGFIYPYIYFYFDIDDCPELIFPFPVDEFEVDAAEFVTTLREGLMEEILAFMDIDVKSKFEVFLKDF